MIPSAMNNSSNRLLNIVQVKCPTGLVIIEVHYFVSYIMILLCIFHYFHLCYVISINILGCFLLLQCIEVNDAVSNKKIGTIIESEVQAKWDKIKETKGGSLLIEKAFDSKKKMKVTVEKFRNPDSK